jgi:hypothetical protein
VPGSLLLCARRSRVEAARRADLSRAPRPPGATTTACPWQPASACRPGMPHLVATVLGVVRFALGLAGGFGPI